MAKKVGSDQAPKMTSPGATQVSDNVVVTEGSFLTAVKEITAATEKVRMANEQRKAVRKKWKASGIVLGPLDTMVKMAEWSRGEVRDHFSVEKLYATWLGLPVEGRQADAFKGMADDEIQRREWAAAGRTASRTGKPARPPEECPEEFHQAFMRGFNDEDEAAWGESETQDVQEPAATGAQPADHDASQPNWSQFADDPDEWLDPQREQFQAWYDGLPAAAVVILTHEGVKAAFLAEQARDLAEGGEVAADAPRLEGQTLPAPVETADAKRNRIFNEGVQACRENVPRANTPDYDKADVAIWLDGWEHQASKEMAEGAAKSMAPKPKGGAGKAVH